MAVVVIVLTAWCGLCLAGWVDLVRRYRAARRADVAATAPAGAMRMTPTATAPAPTGAALALADADPAPALLA